MTYLSWVIVAIRILFFSSAAIATLSTESPNDRIERPQPNSGWIDGRRQAHRADSPSSCPFLVPGSRCVATEQEKRP